jgi:hypothetical protein
MTLMTRGLVITATTRNDAPQRGQWPMSMPNTRRKALHPGHRDST